MIRKFFLTIVLFIFSVGFGLAQNLEKPTLTPKPSTEAQKKLIDEGIALHDQKLYDDAIKRYEKVLAENPDNNIALYETAFSFYEKKDFENSLKYAYRLVKYKGKTGILGYGLIANILDDQNKPQEALNIYRKAIEILKDDPEYKAQVGSLYLNMGITYARLNQYKEAREAEKKALEYDFSLKSPHFILSEIYFGSNYRIPAMLASGKFLTSEVQTERAKRAAAIFNEVLSGGAKVGDKKDKININLNSNAPKDEGDFDSIEMFLAFGSALNLSNGKDKKNENKSAEDLLADRIETMIVNLEADSKKNGKTFVGKNYYPFFIEMKRLGHVKAFANLVAVHLESQTAGQWLSQNMPKVEAFAQWAESFQPPR